MRKNRVFHMKKLISVRLDKIGHVYINIFDGRHQNTIIEETHYNAIIRGFPDVDLNKKPVDAPARTG